MSDGVRKKKRQQFESDEKNIYDAPGHKTVVSPNGRFAGPKNPEIFQEVRRDFSTYYLYTISFSKAAGPSGKHRKFHEPVPCAFFTLLPGAGLVCDILFSCLD